MSNRLEEAFEKFKNRHPYLGYVIGGLLIVVDNIGRMQVVRDVWAEIKMMFIHPAWPSHLLTWVGASFILLGLISRFWPKPTAVVPLVKQPIVAIPMPVQEPPPIKSDRVILGPHLTPKYFYELLKGKTELQANKLVELYIGKWMRISGKVTNISESLTEKTLIISITLTDSILPYPMVAMAFNKAEWHDHISVISKGEQISAIGKIRSVEQNWTWLEDCELEK